MYIYGMFDRDSVRSRGPMTNRKYVLGPGSDLADIPLQSPRVFLYLCQTLPELRVLNAEHNDQLADMGNATSSDQSWNVWLMRPGNKFYATSILGAFGFKLDQSCWTGPKLLWYCRKLIATSTRYCMWKRKMIKELGSLIWGFTGPSEVQSHMGFFLD